MDQKRMALETLEVQITVEASTSETDLIHLCEQMDTSDVAADIEHMVRKIIHRNPAFRKANARVKVD